MNLLAELGRFIFDVYLSGLGRAPEASGRAAPTSRANSDGRVADPLIKLINSRQVTHARRCAATPSEL